MRMLAEQLQLFMTLWRAETKLIWSLLPQLRVYLIYLCISSSPPKSSDFPPSRLCRGLVSETVLILIPDFFKCTIQLTII